MSLWVILFITCCCTVTLAQLPSDCCLKVGDTPIKQALVADYRQQISGEGCDINATVFITRRGRMLCGPPHVVPWVQDLMKHVDHLKKKCKRLNYKSQQCFGVRPQ